MLTKSKINPLECRICGALAFYKYFGIISCNACKIFFKRNAQIGLAGFRCLLNGHCEINLTTRHICTWCRLNKCFQSGMQIELIRCSRNTNSIVKQNSNHTILTNHQWNILLNIIRAFSNEHLFSQIENQLNLPIKLRLKISSIYPICRMFSEQIERFLKFNRTFHCLSIHDETRIFQLIMKHFSSILIVLLFNDIPNSIRNFFCKNFHQEKNFPKLAIVLLMFQINFDKHHFDNFQRIFHLENFYIDLTWKYLRTKYNFNQSIFIFLDLFQLNCYLIKIIEQQQHELYYDLIQQLFNKINKDI